MGRSSDHDDALLAEVLKHPGFSVLEKRVEERRTEEALILANTMVTQDGIVQQRKIDRMRGFWQGVEWFIRETKRGARAFDKGDVE